MLGSLSNPGASLADDQGDRQGNRTSLLVEVENQLVTVAASAVPARQIIEEIARQTGLMVVSREALDELVTVEFHQLPLPKAIGRVLREQSFMLQYRPSSPDVSIAEAASPGRLWVLSDGAQQERDGSFALYTDDPYGRIIGLSHTLTDTDIDTRLEAVDRLAILDGEQSASALAAAALSHGDSLVREEAVFAFGARGDDASIEVLRQALLDPDANVRQAAVDAFTEIGGDDSAMALAIVLHDQDASLREEVVYALGEIGGAAAIDLLAQAQGDPERHIQQAATELLDRLSN